MLPVSARWRSAVRCAAFANNCASKRRSFLPAIAFRLRAASSRLLCGSDRACRREVRAAMPKVSLRSPVRIKAPVATIAMRRSHRSCDFAKRYSTLRGCVSRCFPTIYGAEPSTKSQLLMRRVCLQIKIEDFLLGGGITGFVLGDQNRQTRRAVLVDARVQEFFNIAQLEMAELFRDGSLCRHGDADELVAFSVFAFAGFEKPARSPRARFGLAARANSRFKARQNSEDDSTCCGSRSLTPVNARQNIQTLPRIFCSG